jgi:predicted Zn-dependent protease
MLFFGAPCRVLAYEDARSLVPDPDRADEAQWARAREKLYELIEAHPNNPWPFAILLSTFAERFGQDQEDAFARENAVLLLPEVKQAMRLFEHLYHRRARIREVN